LISCSNDDRTRERAVQELAPNIPQEMLEHLSSSSDSSFARYARTLGLRELRDAAYSLFFGIKYDTVEEYERSTSLLLPLAQRAVDAIALEYGLSEYSVQFRTLQEMSPADGMRYCRLSAEYKILGENAKASQAKIDHALAIVEGFNDLGVESMTPPVLNLIAETYNILKDRSAAEKYYRLSLKISEKHHRTIMTCQTLGNLGAMFRLSGEIDSMKYYYDRTFEIAKRYQLPDQAARITSFYAYHYAATGRLSLAQRLFDESVYLGRANSGNYFAVRHLYAAMRQRADLGLWEIVQRNLAEARVLLRSSTATQATFVELFKGNTDLIEARYLMATGQTDAAGSIFSRLQSHFEQLPNAGYYAEFLIHWAEGLIANSRWDNALDVIETGLEVSAEGVSPFTKDRLLTLKIKASIETGDVGSARRILENTAWTPLPRVYTTSHESIDRDILSVELCLAEGDTVSAYAAVDTALCRLENTLGEIDAGVAGYLWLGRFDELRRILHDRAVEDPLLGYGIEVLWRDLHRQLDRNSRHGDSGRPGGQPCVETWNYSSLRKVAENAISRISGASAIHCVYAVHNDGIVRWTCRSGAVRRQVLDVSAANLLEEVGQTWKLLAANPDDPDAAPSSDLAATLKSLARQLLPEDVFDSSTINVPLYVSSDGFLGQIPFEALNVSNGDGYEPLLRHREVVYIRHIDDAVPGTGYVQRGLVVVNPQLSPRPGYFDLADRSATGTTKEGQVVASLYPNTILLQRETATKMNLTKHWNDASLVYIAGHVIRDADIPYLLLVPLATTEGDVGPDAGYLDISDVRETDLTGCDLVVLSGCSSGAPYVGRHNTGPSLGDAFLDSGAAAVIQTFWDVRDDQAKELMTSFATRWDGTREGVTRALCDVRREAMMGPNGIRHPFLWSAYSVKINLR
jgi:hypothetical protein